MWTHTHRWAHESILYRRLLLRSWVPRWIKKSSNEIDPERERQRGIERDRDREGLRESERYWEFSRTGVSCLIFCKPLSYVSSIFIYLLCFKNEDAKEVEAAIVLHLFGIFCKYFRLLEKKKDAKEVEAAVAEMLTPEKLSNWNFDLFALRELAGRLHIYTCTRPLQLRY